MGALETIEEAKAAMQDMVKFSASCSFPESPNDVGPLHKAVKKYLKTLLIKALLHSSCVEFFPEVKEQASPDLRNSLSTRRRRT